MTAVTAWSTARKGCLVLGAASFTHAIVKKNPILPLVLYGTHLAEYLLVAKKAGMTIPAALSRRCFTASPSGYR